jgi:hypothetical protein
MGIFPTGQGFGQSPGIANFVVSYFDPVSLSGMEIHSPYSPPAEVGVDASQLLAQIWGKRTFWRRMIGVAALLFAIPLLLGIFSTVVAMNKAFADLGNSGIGDPKALSETIGEAIISIVAGLFISMPGLIFLVTSIFKFLSYRKKLSDKSLTVS